MTLQPALEFDNFKHRLKSCIFKRISWLNGSLRLGDDWGFVKEEDQDLFNDTNVAPYYTSPPFFFCLLIYSLCLCQGVLWYTSHKLFSEASIHMY
jgi:hypothetical protein